MEPLNVLAWVGVWCLSIIFASITWLVFWTVVQTIRGKTVRKPSTKSTAIKLGAP